MTYNAKRSRNLFVPYSDKEYKLSRSKIELFMQCPRCFYLDRRIGVGRPPSFPFNLNIAVDLLLKKEFDLHRKNQTAHPLMVKHKIDAIPFQHKEIDHWRENFRGAQAHFEPANFIVFGAVDDIWVDKEGKLIIVDYKATSREGKISMKSAWYDSYRRQIDIYQWIFRQLGFDVNPTGYFLYCNGDRSRAEFNGRLEFDMEIFPYKGSGDWIEPTLLDIYATLSEHKPPKASKECEFCAYREAAKDLDSPSSLF